MKKGLYGFFSFIVCLFFIVPLSSCDGNNISSVNSGTNKNPYVTNVEILNLPNKTEYLEHEIFDPAGLTYNATWVIKGKEKVITLGYGQTTWTHKDEPLTSDVNKITFTIMKTDYSFDVNINVTKLDIKELSIDRTSINDNYLEGTKIDLTTLVVSSINNEGEARVISTGSYKLYDNDVEIENSDAYVLTAGEHVFKASFGQQTKSFTVRSWGYNELHLDKVVVSNNRYDYLILPGDYIDLSKIIVTKTLINSDKTVSFDIVTSDYKLYDGTYLLSSTELSNYCLTAGKHSFKVTIEGVDSEVFNVEVSEFDKIIIEKKDASVNSVGQNSSFYSNFSVYLAVSQNISTRRLINSGDYKLSAKKNGVEVEDVNEDNIFQTSGLITVIVSYHNIKEEIVVDVIGALSISSANIVYTDLIPVNNDGSIRRDAQGNLINEDGTPFQITKDSGVYGVRSTYTVGNSFLEIPKNGAGSYGNMGVYDLSTSPHVGGIGAGQKLIFHIWSNYETNVKIVLYAASTQFTNSPKDANGNYIITDTCVGNYMPTVTKDVQFNQALSASYNNGTGETPITISDDIIVPGFESQITVNNGYACDLNGRYYDKRVWTTWMPVVFGNMKLSKGDNLITLKVVKNWLNIGQIEVQFI